jgi:hypothetical protein
MMVIGINKICEHDGRKLHIQAEDLGDKVGAFEVRVYDGGSVLFLKRIPYTELMEKQLPKKEHELTLRAMMEKITVTVEAAIAKGKIG